jgi:hypothetical protein
LPQRGHWQKPVDAPLFSCYNTRRYGVKMTVKLLLLKSGEDIIADVQEMISGEDTDSRVIGYYLDKPCIVKIRDSQVLTEETEATQKSSFQVSLFPWMPLSADNKIPIPADWVVTIVEPKDKLKQMYIEDVVNYGESNDKSDATAEQSDSDIKD